MNYEREELELKYEITSQLRNLVPERGLKNTQAFEEKMLWALQDLKPKFHIAFGNFKLPESTAIVNLGTWFNCSGRTEGFCDICVECYDKCKEVMFKKIIKARLEQELFFRHYPADVIADKIIREILAQNARDKKPTVDKIRFSEVGEMRNQADFEKVIEISNIVYDKLNIESYIYTHNKYLDFNVARPHLTVNGSGFMVDNEYRVINKGETVDEKHYDCLCDCKNGCDICTRKLGIIIVEELRL